MPEPSRLINDVETTDKDLLKMFKSLVELDPNQLETEENANLNDLFSKVDKLWKELC